MKVYTSTDLEGDPQSEPEEKARIKYILKQYITMTAEQFFYLVKMMRQAQREYFAERSQIKLRVARALEGDVDREILRVMDVLKQREEGGQ